MDAGGRRGARLAIGVAALLVAAGAARAGSISFAGSTSGVFNNPVGGTSTGVGTSSISFGTPPGALSFTGGSFTGVATGQIFSLGSIGYYNAENVNPIMGVTLGMSLAMTDGAKGPTAANLPLLIDNTPAIGVPDTLSLKPNTEIGTLTGTDGKTYSLLVVGFSPPCTESNMVYTPTLTANEGQVVTSNIYAEWEPKSVPTGGTPPPGGSSGGPTTPEPAGLVLIAVGLATVGARRWRKK
jgi:hypothetical protein